MLDLPDKTLFDRRIDKKKFYEARPVAGDVKRLFVDEVECVRWRHKISPETMNIAPGATVREIEVIEIAQKTATLSERVLEYIDKAIPYQILFVATFEGNMKAYMAHKEVSDSGAVSLKSKRYFSAPLAADDALALDGLDMDAVYANLVRRIAGGKIAETGGDLSAAVAANEAREKLVREIDRLEKKARTEKQPRRKMEYFKEAQALREQLRHCAGPGIMCPTSPIRHCEEPDAPASGDVAISCESGAE